MDQILDTQLEVLWGDDGRVGIHEEPDDEVGDEAELKDFPRLTC
jgi:hypothetical protein